jgi:hypothetical protein
MTIAYYPFFIFFESRHRNRLSQNNRTLSSIQNLVWHKLINIMDGNPRDLLAHESDCFLWLYYSSSTVSLGGSHRLDDRPCPVSCSVYVEERRGRDVDGTMICTVIEAGLRAIVNSSYRYIAVLLCYALLPYSVEPGRCSRKPRAESFQSSQFGALENPGPNLFSRARSVL